MVISKNAFMPKCKLSNSKAARTGITWKMDIITQQPVTEQCSPAGCRQCVHCMRNGALHRLANSELGHSGTPFPSLPPSLFPGPHPLNQLGDLGECCKLPSGVWGKAPADKRFGAYLSHKKLK